MKKVTLFFALIPWLLLTSMGQEGGFPEANISNGLINAHLYLPDNETGYYRATRFDRSGIITSLKFEGHEFYGQWFPKYDPQINDAVMGPVEEFQPVGYESAKPGATFLKIGVGMLKKPEEKAYTFGKLYQVENAGTWKTKVSSDKVRYTHTLKDVNHSYVYKKEIRLVSGKSELVISHSFTNKGKTPIETTVYNHNFPVIDKQPTGPGYVITFPFNLTCETGQGFGDVININGNKLVYARDQAGRDRVYCGDIKGYGETAKDYDIRIENTTVGAGIRVTCDRPLVKLVYWSSSTTPCPEPYIKVVARPGEEYTWEMKYEYYILK